MRCWQCWTGATLALLVIIIGGATAQCPWSRSVPALHGSCACSYNLAQELTLQCGQVNFTTLMEALNGHAHNQIIDLLYVHNSSVPELRDNALDRLTVHNIQLSRCQIRSIGARAFAGQETSLKNLNLQDNQIASVPTEALRSLKALALLDLSGNRIGRVAADAFAPLKLTTLKLADNANLTLTEHAFRGLESTLKNLNVKGTRLREVPAEALRSLTSLAFLDLAQNGIRSLGSGLFRQLDSLTALNLERNSLSNIEPEAFVGVNDTLSSLSLLNNLITEFPVRGLASLSQLRVLDVGFNLISRLPENAFSPASQLTLLALDGNPLATLPRSAFGHLNGTLRGLSLGGRFLACDCRLQWIAEWIRDTDLQVTSRERNPQFCGSPVELRSRSFYQLAPEEFKCDEEPVKASQNKEEGFKPIASSSTSTTTTESATTAQATIRGKVYDDEVEEVEEDELEAENGSRSPSTAANTLPPTTLPTTIVSSVATFAPQPVQASVPQSPSRRQQQQTSQLQKQAGSLASAPTRTADASPVAQRNTPAPNYRGSYQQRPVSPSNANKNNRGSNAGPGTRARPYGPSGRPNLITGNSYQNDNLGLEGIPSSSSSLSGEREVIVKDAYRQDTSVVIQWDSETNHILGFRVVYRLFGDNTFQPGPPLDPSEREFKIKNVPAQESLVVCVVSLEESNVTPETVPFAQCREIRTESQPSSHMDKIIIAASAAICGTVVLAVVIFICCNRKRSLKSEKLRLSNVLAAGGVAGPGMVAGGGCASNGIGTATTSLAGSQGQTPLTNLAAMGQGANGKDWDQLSMYSSRSIPRARMYHSDRPGSVMGSVNGGYIPDDARSHVSGYSMNKAGAAGNLIRSRSLIDGQSQRSVSAMSGRGGAYLPPAMHHSGLGPHLGGLGMGLGGLAMPGLGGSMNMNAMAGLPPLGGMGLSRADLRASQHSLADLRMNELAAASAMANGRASRNSRASTRAGSQYSGRRSEQMRRRAAQLQHHDSSDQHQQQQQTTGDESSWETDREPGGGGSSSTSGLLASRRSQQMASIHSRHGNGHRPRAGSSVRSGETENWTDHDMDIYTTNHTMRNDLVRL